MTTFSELRRSEKLPSASYTKEDIKTIVEKISEIIPIKKRERRGEYIKNEFEIESSIKTNSTIYDLKQNDVNNFFESEIMIPELVNLSMTWNYLYRKYSEDFRMSRRITIILTKKGSTINIVGESKKWINQVLTTLNDIIDRIKTKNERNNNIIKYISIISVSLLTLLLAINYFQPDLYSIILVVILIIASSFIIWDNLDTFPHTRIIVDPNKIKESKIKQWIIGLIITLIDTIIVSLILKFLFGWNP